MSVLPSNQTSSRNLKDILIKFGADSYYCTEAKSLETDYDWSIISPSPHTNVLGA